MEVKKGTSAQQLEDVPTDLMICVVNMQYHPEHEVYTLSESCGKGLALWLEEHQAKEIREARGLPAPTVAESSEQNVVPIVPVRCSRIGPQSRVEKRQEKEVRRSARLQSKQ